MINLIDRNLIDSLLNELDEFEGVIRGLFAMPLLDAEALVRELVNHVQGVKDVWRQVTENIDDRFDLVLDGIREFPGAFKASVIPWTPEHFAAKLDEAEAFLPTVIAEGGGVRMGLGRDMYARLHNLDEQMVLLGENAEQRERIRVLSATLLEEVFTDEAIMKS